MAVAAAAPDRVAECAAELVAQGALEISADRAGDAAMIVALLPAGTRTYVTHLPRHSLAQSLPALAAARAAGLEPVPHVAARRVASRRELKDFLVCAVHESGIAKVLLIGGDDAHAGHHAESPYSDALALLRDGVIAECGIREVALPGYPEGHPHIEQAAIDRALDDKLALLRSQGLDASLITQFSFAPARIVEYVAEMSRRLPRLPIYVGMAGPTDALTLLRFAQRCGVSASLRAMSAQGMAAVEGFMHTDPSEQLQALAQYCLRHESTCGSSTPPFSAQRRSCTGARRRRCNRRRQS
jgi:methylenetetrahydrofolate reductase (NADPH)